MGGLVAGRRGLGLGARRWGLGLGAVRCGLGLAGLGLVGVYRSPSLEVQTVLLRRHAGGRCFVWSLRCVTSKC